MSITTINSTMQAQIMQDVQRMQANAQAPVQVRNKIATGFNDLMSMSI